MSNKLDMFSSIIKSKIDKYLDKIEKHEDGYVISVKDGVVIANGLSDVMLDETVIFENGTHGIVMNLEEDCVCIICLGNFSDIKEGSLVKRTKNILSVGVGDNLLGRIVDPLGKAIDGNTPITNYTAFNPIDTLAPGVMKRKSVNQPLETGILLIDSMFPIGKGQRELIIGDRQTGKTTIAIDTIINQKNKNVYCVYVAIGQKNSSVMQVSMTLKYHDALKYTTIVSAAASDAPAIKYIAPYSGMAIAEYWMSKGKDVLIIFDDLSKHAASYRTISLLLRRPPGREAYPGDIFYLHSRLLERACRLDKKFGGGSITALPIIETQAEDISAYIPTNVISITDGQLFMVSSMFNEGQRPAISTGLSVSRVGSAAQIKAMKQVCSSLKLELAQYEELISFSQFSSDLDKSTKKILEHGKRIMLVINQIKNNTMDQFDQIIILFAVKYYLIDWIPLDKISLFKEELPTFINKHKIRKILVEKKEFTNDMINEMSALIKSFVKQFVSKIKDYDPKKYGDINIFKKF